MSKLEKRILDFVNPTNHERMMEILHIFSQRYPFMEMNMLGKSILGRHIPVIRLGKGEKKVLYLGAHRGAEWGNSALLLRFINEFGELMLSSGSVEHMNVSTIWDRRSIFVVPMLNPDGVAYVTDGVDENNLLWERALSMNGKSRDFSAWQANARGVDLCSNYNVNFAENKKKGAQQGLEAGECGYAGESSESEPEVAALCRFLRYFGDFSLALCWESGTPQVSYCRSKTRPESEAVKIGRCLSRFCGYPLAENREEGFCRWFAEECGQPALGIKTQPGAFSDLGLQYLIFRRLLFGTPLLL